MTSVNLTDVQRRLFEWVEIQQPICTRVYTESPCAAVPGVTGEDKCYNTRFTCQDPTNYDTTSSFLSLNFCFNQSKIPKDAIYLPWLESVSINPSVLNIGGGDRNSGTLGTRGALSCTFSDHPYSDNLTDPYIDDRDFIAYDRGTFWSKWRARNPFYLNRVIKYHTCYLDEDGEKTPDTTETRTYFISDFSGPTSGNMVSIRGDDILVFALNERAQAPKLSTGKLTGALAIDGDTLTLEPAGVGNDEYPASGSINIGGEIITFTRSGDVMTLTARGTRNTEAKAHSAGDTVQLCLQYAAKLPREILQSLLEDYADVDAQWLDLTQWAEETTAFLPRLYGAFIPEPTSVKQLLEEITEQMYFTVYWIDTEAKLKIKAVRPPAGANIPELEADKNLLKDSVSWTDDSEQLLTQVWVYYAQANPVIKLDQEDNYRVRDAVLNLPAEGLDQNGTRKIKKIYSRWMSSTDGAAALELSERLIERYGSIPRQVTFKLDAKDAGTINLADFVKIKNRQSVDIYGVPQFMSLQVISMKQLIARHVYQYTAMQYTGETIINPDEYTIVISGTVNDINLRALFDASYAVTLESGDKVRYIIREGAIVGGTIDSVAAITTGSFPTGVLVFLDNDGSIVGKGGDGGAATYNGATTTATAGNGTNGGSAFSVAYPISITNYGLVGAGGGGGGACVNYSTNRVVCLGGCAAATNGVGGAVAVTNATGRIFNGESATGISRGGPLSESLNIGGVFDLQALTQAGDINQDGPDGFSVGLSGVVVFGFGGTKGAAVSAGANLITWIVKGDVRGAEIT
jgi:hypothetical protein